MNCPELHCTGRHSTSIQRDIPLCPRARRRKSDNDRRAKRLKRGAEVHDEVESEVKVVAGRCVTWNCYNPAPDGPECPEHAAEPLPVIRRLSRAEAERKRRQEDPEYAERVRARKRASARTARQDPEYRERTNERKRESNRLAARAKLGLTDVPLDVPLQTAVRERRRDEILARLRKGEEVRVGPLAKEFEVGPNCITEDIRHLADNGLAERVHGGARLPLESTSNHEVGSIV